MWDGRGMAARSTHTLWRRARRPGVTVQVLLRNVGVGVARTRLKPGRTVTHGEAACEARYFVKPNPGPSVGSPDQRATTIVLQ